MKSSTANAPQQSQNNITACYLQCFSQNFWQMISGVCLKFRKFATNLAISLRSRQSNCELGNKVVNFTTNFIGKLSWSQEKFAPFGVKSQNFLRSCGFISCELLVLKWVIKCWKLNFPRCHLTPASK